MTASHTMVRRLRRSLRALAAAVAAAAAAGCNDPAITDYNNPVVGLGFTDISQVQAQALGLLAGDRDQHAFEILVLETMGRDAYRIDVADPRYLLQPLGQFSPGAFLADFTYNIHYRTIRGAQLLVRDAEASSLLDAAGKAGVRGWARTWQANQYVRLIETRDTIGVPIVSISDAVEPVRCKPAVLATITALLDTATRDLAQGGAAFAFPVASGLRANGAFDTPAAFARFARALQAKAYVYRGFRDYARSGAVDAVALDSALRALDLSFYAPAGDLRAGVYHVYGLGSGDQTNANYDLSVYRANPKVVAEAEPGDARLAKVAEDPARRLVVSGITSDLLFTNLTGPTSPLPVITNEELILVRAEALWGLGRDAEALALVNVIRQRAGQLAPRASTDFPTREALLREILKQKRYSLLFESGARLVDTRMFGLFNELGPELPAPAAGQPQPLGPKVIPLPQAELDARNVAVDAVSCTA